MVIAIVRPPFFFFFFFKAFLGRVFAEELGEGGETLAPK